MSRSSLAIGAVALAAVSLALAAAPAPASAGIPNTVCKAAGDASGLAGKACEVLRNPGQLLRAGKSLITGHIGSAINELLGTGGASSASTALSLAAIVAWVAGGAKAALHEMGKFVSASAAPQLGSVWFSSAYWRMAAVAALLTLPFLFAAAVQALVRSDLALLGRATFGHLPLALVGVGIAAPITMLLLAGTDELCALVWSPSSSNGLLHGAEIAGLASLLHSPFLAFLLFLFTAAGAVLVWLELAMREAAVYIVVLLLPLVFAGLVWPARRVWAVRAVEVLAALILSKFAIVAVLGLGGAALDHATEHGFDAVLAGMVLVLLAALAPWAVLRLVPLTELASSAAGALRPQMQAAWPRKETIQRAETAIVGVAGHLADLATFSNDRTQMPKPGRNGRDWRADLAARGHGKRDDEGVDGVAGAADGEGFMDIAAGAEGMDVAAGAEGADVAAGAERMDIAAGAEGADDVAGAEGMDLAGQVSGGELVGRDATRAGRADRAEVAGRATGRTPDSTAQEERVPGADPMWQAPDMSWRPLTLGMDEGWPPESLWPRGEPSPGRSDALEGPDAPPGLDRPGPAGGAGGLGGPGGLGAGGPVGPSGSSTNDAGGQSRTDDESGDQSDPLPPLQDSGGPL